MNKGITKEDIIQLFPHVCPEIHISEEDIQGVADTAFNGNYTIARGFVLRKAFITAINELYQNCSADKPLR